MVLTGGLHSSGGFESTSAGRLQLKGELAGHDARQPGVNAAAGGELPRTGGLREGVRAEVAGWVMATVGGNLDF